MPCRGELSISHVQVGSEVRWSYEATVTEPQDGIVGAQGREVVLETERWEKMSENTEEGAGRKECTCREDELCPKRLQTLSFLLSSSFHPSFIS